jgi:drug/metabolite transporter (DMT)-like permease
MNYNVLTHALFMLSMLAFLSSAIVIARKKKEGWFQKHRILGITGAVCGIAGFSWMAVLKTVHGYPHLKSPHAIVGFVVILIMAIAPVLGYLLVNKGKENLRAVHKKIGYATVVLGLIAALMEFDELLEMAGLIGKEK